MGLLLWIQIPIYILFQPLQWCIQYHTILERFITAPDFMWRRNINNNYEIWLIPGTWEPMGKPVGYHPSRERKFKTGFRVYTVPMFNAMIYLSGLPITILRIQKLRTTAMFFSLYLEYGIEYEVDLLCIQFTFLTRIFSKGVLIFVTDCHYAVCSTGQPNILSW